MSLLLIYGHMTAMKYKDECTVEDASGCWSLYMWKVKEDLIECIVTPLCRWSGMQMLAHFKVDAYKCRHLHTCT